MLNDQQIKHLMDATIYAARNSNGYSCETDRVCDAVDAIFAERARREQPAPVGPASTAVDETQGEKVADGITSDEMDALSRRMCGIGQSWTICGDDSNNVRKVMATIREAIAIDRSRRDAVRRFTAEEVAERLVRVEPDAVGHRAVVYVGSIGLSVEDHMADAERRAVACRANIRRTLEAQ